MKQKEARKCACKNRIGPLGTSRPLEHAVFYCSYVHPLDRLELLAKTVNENKYLAGDKLCCADFAFVELVEMVEFLSDGKVFEKYPALKTYRDDMFELSGLKEYIQKRARLPFNNKVAKINN